MFERIYQQHWIDLPKEVRLHLIKIFDIPQSGITEIRDQAVVSDGHTNADLESITKERMSAYTGSPTTESFFRLWEITLSKVNFELHPPVGTIVEGGNVTDNTTGAPVTIQAPQELPKKYCETCVSTQGRHRKGCPKFK